MPVQNQILSIFAGVNGFIDDLDIAQVRPFEAELQRYIQNAHPAILSDIVEKKAIDDDLKARMKAAIKECKDRFVAGLKK